MLTSYCRQQTIYVETFFSISDKKDKEPPTVFIDLRGFEAQKKEEQQGLESVQRVLGIAPGQRCVVCRKCVVCEIYIIYIGCVNKA